MMLKVIDMNRTCYQNAGIAEVNIGFYCENSIVVEN